MCMHGRTSGDAELLGAPPKALHHSAAQSRNAAHVCAKHALSSAHGACSCNSAHYAASQAHPSPTGRPLAGRACARHASQTQAPAQCVSVLLGSIDKRQMCNRYRAAVCTQHLSQSTQHPESITANIIAVQHTACCRSSVLDHQAHAANRGNELHLFLQSIAIDLCRIRRNWLFSGGSLMNCALL